MSARNVQVGELVRVVIERAKVETVESDSLLLEVGAGQVMVPLDEPDVTVSRLAPVEWPPLAGDVWEHTYRAGPDATVAAVSRWFAMGGEGHVRLHSADGSRAVPPDAFLDSAYAPPRLLSREGWTPTSSPAAEPEVTAPVVESADKRTAIVAGLRELADLFESRQDMPVPTTGQLSVTGSLAEMFDGDAVGMPAMEAAAAVLGVAVSRNGHWHARKGFGPINVDFHYIPEDYWREYNAKRAASTSDEAGEPTPEGGEPRG